LHLAATANVAANKYSPAGHRLQATSPWDSTNKTHGVIALGYGMMINHSPSDVMVTKVNIFVFLFLFLILWFSFGSIL